MRLELELKNGTLVARVDGELDLAGTEYFRQCLEKSLDEKPVQNLILNFEGVSFIDSSGLAAILGRYKRISQAGGKVFVVGAQSQVKRVLELSGILRIIRDFSTEDEALAAIF